MVHVVSRMSKFDKLNLVLSIYVIIELWISTIVSYSVTVHKILTFIDTCICVIFLYDFFYRLYYHPNKMRFIRSNWIDFISAIPHMSYLRIGRLARMIRILRFLRSSHLFFHLIRTSSGVSLFQTFFILNIFFVLCMSISIYVVENPVNPQFKTITDSIWWAIVTTTTVGYGDIVPITVEGRAIAVSLMIMGISLTSALTVVIVRYFIKDHSSFKEHVLQKQLNAIEKKLDQLLKDKK